jgi:hypothetical protein
MLMKKEMVRTSRYSKAYYLKAVSHAIKMYTRGNSEKIVQPVIPQLHLRR